MPPTPTKYLVVPMPPTPNGRLHIGHGAGPYLRADVLARDLRRSGHDVEVISGSDVYENWILLDALTTGRSPEEVSTSFHELIKADLVSLDVSVDTWINPLDADHQIPYRLLHERLIEELAELGQAKRSPECVPFSSGSGRCVIGVWLYGRCPNCGDDVGGNCCEACGYHFQPSEVLDPRSRLDEGPLVWETHESWFLEPTDRDSAARSIGSRTLRPQFTDVAARYLHQTSGRIRLSQPGSWGLRSDLAGPGAVLSNTFYAFSLYCGEVYARRRGGVNPFSLQSDVTTVALFGIDNAVAGIVAPDAMALAHGKIKPFDHLVVNEFLHLEGAKCSTSRNHAIWLTELIERSSVAADELRYYMAHQPLDDRPGDFTVAGLVDATNDVRRWRRHVLAPALELAGPDVDGATIGRLHRAVDRQSAHLDPDRMSLPGAVSVLDDWIARCDPYGDDGPGATAWLIGVAVLADPIMPGLAAELWHGLGLPGTPTLAAVGACGPSPGPASCATPGPVSVDDVRPFVHLGASDA
jgi:methionyl-tRNA synthetase